MQKNHNMSNMGENHYRKLLIMTVLSCISIYLLMFAMVNSIDNVSNSFNQFYMAGLMTAPIIPLELFLMKAMYPDKRRNAFMIAASVVNVLEPYPSTGECLPPPPGNKKQATRNTASPVSCS